MSGAEILSLVGIIIGLAVLVVLVMKGINIYVVAFIASIIVAVFGRMNLYEALFLPMVVSAFTLYHLRFSRLHLKFSMKQIYRETIFRQRFASDALLLRW